MRVDVAFLPPSESPAAQTCLVVDVLRATSVMAVLAARGVRGIWPAPSIEAGRRLRSALAAVEGGVMLCGEEAALAPAGYDFGNSPSEFAALDPLPASHAVVATTNGTPALVACMDAPLTMSAAILNAGAATRLAAEAGRDVLVVCAGTAGRRSDDDVLAAGSLAERLTRAGATPGDEAVHAIDQFEAGRGDLVGALRATPHGRRLQELGFAADLEFCADVDRYDAVAVLHREPQGAVLRPV
jgi:2-phosphosulfolactate phosphatase